ncbi:MAG: TolC family protein [Puniceicoccaceae bacterium]
MSKLSLKIFGFVWALLMVAALMANGETGDEAPALNLDRALQLAVESNFGIQRAIEQIEEQEGVILSVKSSLLPNASVSGNYNWLDRGLSDPLNPGPSTDRAWSAEIGVRQLFYSGGGVRNSLEAQEFVRSAARLQLMGVVNRELFNVSVRFYDVLLARGQIEVEEENIGLLEEQLGDVRNRFEAGAVSQFEVLQAEVALANGKPRLIRAKNQYRISLEELMQAIGSNPQKAGGVPEIVGELEFEPFAYELEESLMEARRNRPELQALKLLEEAEARGVAVARAGYLPEINGLAAWQFRKSSGSKDLEDSLNGWVLGVEGRWAIWDGNRTAGEVRAARSRLRQAEIDSRDTAFAVEVEVRRAVSALQEAVELVEAAGKVIEQAEESLRLAKVRFDSGAATQLDVLQSQVALTEARLNLLEAKYAHNVAATELRRAVGQPELFVDEDQLVER